MRRAVFLDRDGTLIEEANYLSEIRSLTFFPYTIDAVRLLNQSGFAVVVVTNQAGIARGIVKEAFVAEAHAVLDARLAVGGARIDGYYYCPHHPDGSIAAFRKDCDCRKPRPGQLRQAAADLDLDLAGSFVVGDRWSDVDAGDAVGARGVLVRTGHGRQSESENRASATVTDNLIAAVAWILRQP
ncbi:MAG TPA: HAD family hydrolase [Vicinamibacterales bacterium]|nr:HAD family hydrolase [Vicinamibacterales bacterium]